ncbi:hypothetical protein MMC18_009353, partial [Xylographa bjoerkii]|nr:hypothetical protein [Xylographa bjoerkii]
IVTDMENVVPLIVTYNCGRELVKPELFAHYLANALPGCPSPDFLVLSLQEVAPIAYAFLGGSFLVPYLDRIRYAVDALAKIRGEASYVSLITRNVGMTVLMAFIRQDLLGNVRWMETGGVGVGVHEMGNKGAVGLRLGYATGEETMEMTFVGAHLAPMEWALERRNEDWKNIVRGLVFTPVDKKAVRAIAAARRSQVRNSEDEPLLQGSVDNASTPTSGIYNTTSHLFLAGDLNYRTSRSKPTPADFSQYPQPALDKANVSHYSQLLRSDQLAAELKAQNTAHGLIEAAIDFPPTYKYSDAAREVAATDEQIKSASAPRDNTPSETADQDKTWLWAKHRWPSWCDRILYLDIPPWMSSQDPSARIQIHKYTALPLMSTSDHRPVILSLSLPLQPIPPPNDEVADGDWRLNPPFSIDPQWRQRRRIARWKEIVVGLSAYLGLTWEGRGLLIAMLIGALGGWAVIVSMLQPAVRL